MKKRLFGFVLVVFTAFSLFTLSGCTKETTSLTPAADGTNIDSLPAVPGFAGDIQDIAIPAELEWDRKSSMAIKTESFRGGIYVYKGNVSVMSLKDFMVAAMQDNKWKQVGETSAKDIMLAFVKPNKTCMMVLSEGGVIGKNTLTFYVTIDETAATSLNPFGEAVTQ